MITNLSKQEKLIIFAEFVLETLEDQKEWNDDTIEEISDCAIRMGLARTNENGEFSLDCLPFKN